MKKILLLAFTLALTVGAFAQVPSVPIKKRSSLPSTCSVSTTLQLLVYKTGANSGLYYCSATDTWTPVGAIISEGLESSGVLAGTGLDVAQGTITVNTQPGLDYTATWNAGGVTFTGLKANITDTASAAGSMLLDLQVGGSTKFKVSKAGLATSAGVLSTVGANGYTTGAGGTVTQGTSRTTAVTLNKAAMQITLVSAAGSATPASFTVNNSLVTANDVIHCSQKSGTDLYIISVTNVAAGSFRITSYTTGGTTTEQPVFNCVLTASVAS